MAPTDPNSQRSTKWNLKEFLSNVTSGFFGGGKRVVVPAGRNALGAVTGAPSAAALLARKRATDRYAGPGYRTRMEEAKLRNQMWANDLEAIVLERLKNSFHEENFNRMKLTPSLWSNQMRRIILDLSILYEGPARRRLVEKEKKEEKKQTLGSEPGDESVIPTKDKTKKKEEEKKKEVPEDETPEEKEAREAKEAEAEKEEEGAEADPAEEKKEEEKEEEEEEEEPAPQEADAAEPTDTEQEVPALETGDPDIDALAALLDLEGADEEAEETPLDKVLKLVDLDATLHLVECMTRFHDAVWLRPMVRFERHEIVEDPEKGQMEMGDPTTGKLSFIVYDPSCADVIENPENPSEALAWWYWANEFMPSGTMELRIHFWTKDTYEKYDHEWKMLSQIPNPYGRIPCVKFTSELPTSQSYYCNGMGRDLYEATLELCVLRTIQNARFRDSAFKQLAIMGADENAIAADQVMGGPSPVMLPEGGTATVLDMQPNLQPMTDMVEQRQLEMAATKGISGADYKKDGQAQSGYAKKLDRDKILKENKRIRKFFAESEKDLYSLLAVTLEQHPIAGIPKLDPEAKYEVDFAEPMFEEDPKTQVTVDAQQIKLNQTNIVNILKRDNPDLSEAELVKLAFKNKKINEAFIPKDSMGLIDMLAQAGAAPAGGGFGGGGGGFGKPKPGEEPVKEDKPAPGFPPKKPPFGGK